MQRVAKGMLYITIGSYGVLCKGNGGHRTRGIMQWLDHLAQDIPPFATWFLNIIKVQIANGVDVEPNMILFFCLLNPIAYTYKNMWAYGNHCQVDEHEGKMVHATYDSEVADIFKQGSRCFAQDRNLHYIDVLKEIIVVSY